MLVKYLKTSDNIPTYFNIAIKRKGCTTCLYLHLKLYVPSCGYFPIERANQT